MLQQARSYRLFVAIDVSSRTFTFASMRPRHLETLRLNRDLLDVGLGRLDPHPRHAAEISHYLVAPALSLADLGSYALVLAGLGRATPALTALGLIESDVVGSLPPTPALLRQLAQRSGLDLSEYGPGSWRGRPLLARM
jgi:hypothetical protein